MDSDQLLYFGIFLLIGLIVYRQLCGGSYGGKAPRPAYSFEAYGIGTNDNEIVGK